MYDLKRVLAEKLTLGPVANIPEISMFTAGPNTGLRRILEEHDGAAPPYWAHLWAGGLVLARYVLDHPDTVYNRRVLDVGSGGGLVAIAAAMVGAREVISADIDPLAAIAVSLNAEANGMLVRAETMDAPASDWPDVDVILAGDVFYDPVPARAFEQFARIQSGRGVEVLVGDPWRVHLPVTSMRLIAKYAVHDFGGGSAVVDAGVFQMQPSPLADTSG